MIKVKCITCRNIILLLKTKLMGNETIHRASNMSAHVLLNLLNELGKKKKTRCEVLSTTMSGYTVCLSQ